MACALAAPATYVSSKATSYTAPAVTILKQINQLNGDGSYTFGYEASDGSFRVENMDVDGYITGRYGYVDAYGQPQETGMFTKTITSSRIFFLLSLSYSHLFSNSLKFKLQKRIRCWKAVWSVRWIPSSWYFASGDDSF